jgi:hypothetical protein
VLKAALFGVLKVANTALIASARYRPGFYTGELTLFNPEAIRFFVAPHGRRRLAKSTTPILRSAFLGEPAPRRI